MGWQSGQNTGNRNTVYQNELNSYMPGAKAAGLTDAEINDLINQNSAATNQENQNRIAQDAAKGNGWVNQNIPGGYTTLAALTAAVAAPYAYAAFAPEALTTTELLGGAGGAFTPTAGYSFTLPEAIGATEAASGGLTAAEMAAGSGNPATSGLPYGQAFSNAEIAAGTGTPLTSGLPASDVWGPTYGELGYTGAGTPETLAAISAADAAALAAGVGGGSLLSNIAKGALLATALKAAGGSNTKGGITTTGGGFNPYSTASSGLNSQLPGYIHGNDTPFVFSKEQPIQDTRQASYNPFDALNVKEPIPGLPQNPYAKSLLG